MLNEMEQIEQSIQSAKQQIELGSALQRLRNNKDFKKIFGELYFREEPIRLVMALSNPHLQDAVAQTSLHNQMQSIGCVADFLRVIEHNAYLAQKNLESAEALHEELLAGGNEE